MKERKKVDKKGRVWFSFWIDLELRRKLKAVAAISDESMSDTINRALHQFVERNQVSFIPDGAGK